MDTKELNTSRRPLKGKTITLCKDYYYQVPVLYYITVFVGFSLFAFLCFDMTDSLFSNIGAPGRRLLYLKENYLFELRFGFFLAILIHVLEAAYAYYLCCGFRFSPDCTKKWVIQTSMVGYSSLRYLICYTNSLETKSQ